MKCRLSIWFLFFCVQTYSQSQTCPININYGTGDLSHWYAYTGNNRNGNGSSAIIDRYDSTTTAPTGTKGAGSIPEYNLPAVEGIQVQTSNNLDAFGGFPTIPVINGYSYNYSIRLGSTSVTRGNGNGNAGGYIRGISYQINVPPGPSTEPYTMTYAYAMVLENGTHKSNEQPMISATLQTPAGPVSCASPSYYLPTFNNVQGSGDIGATLDSAAAKLNGFQVSGKRSPNFSPPQGLSPGGYLQDVWTKGWTEVTFDLSPYRGQQVSLTFEADNCTLGGHFAYAYIAIRNSCAGLQISGDSLACNNSLITFSVPALQGASYNWTFPPSWQLVSSDTSNIIQIKSSYLGGAVSVREINSCTNLSDTLQIKTLPSPIGGNLSGSTEVCTGANSSTLNLVNYSGGIIDWVSSTDSLTWLPISNTNTQYIVQNLSTTTLFKAVVGKGNVCPPDSSSVARILVDQKTRGGLIDPAQSILCAGQTAGQLLTLSGNLGQLLNWQSSTDGINWIDQSPADSSTVNLITGITANTQYRLIDKNGVCPADTSTIASIQFDPASFPVAEATPADTTICFGTSASLFANIQTGTSYAWVPDSVGKGSIGNTPFQIQTSVSPDSTANFVLQVLNNGCPNPLSDTFHVQVRPPIIVHAGRDTSVVVGEPLQFQAYSNDSSPDNFAWLPATGLDNPNIADPVGTYNAGDGTITYTVKVFNELGCSGQASITVRVFKTKPDIFVPNAFTPGTARNSVFRPIPVGISSLQYFRVYNRLGQLVYATSAIGSGWDGSLNGIPQSSGAYVWMVKGTSYTGDVITRDGTMVLIR